MFSPDLPDISYNRNSLIVNTRHNFVLIIHQKTVELEGNSDAAGESSGHTNNSSPTTTLENQPSKVALMLDLNDDCLLEIFENVVNKEDFLSLSKVCQRFLPIVKQAFSKRFHTTWFTHDASDKDIVKKAREHDFLTTFGGCITGLIGFGEDGVLDMLSTYYKKLKTLKLFVFNDDTSTMYNVFQQLTALTLLDGKFKEDSSQLYRIFKYCGNLKELQIDLNPNCLPALAGSIKSLGDKNMLQYLKIGLNTFPRDGVRSFRYEDDLFEAILSCKNLIYFRVEPYLNFNDQMLKRLSLNLPHLTKIWISEKSDVSSTAIVDFIKNGKKLLALKMKKFSNIIENESQLIQIAREYDGRLERKPLTIYLDMSTDTLRTLLQWNESFIANWIIFKEYDSDAEFLEKDPFYIEG